jgi:hypothetical protein
MSSVSLKSNNNSHVKAEEMTSSLRPCWRNCALKADSEILDIDKMEDRIAPVGPDISKIRGLITSLELCHHKADRWVYNIIQAIGEGDTRKELGTRPPGRQHPAEKVWQNACAALSAWCAGRPGTKTDLSIDTVPASQLLGGLGERSPLKEWQVQRVIDKIRSLINWPQPYEDPSAQYPWLLLSVGEYDFTYLNQCPEQFGEHKDFWLKTVRTIIHDTENGDEAELSLGLAIDNLWPCHWRFVENLRIVLDAIGGRLNPKQSFAACGRNIKLLPIRRRMETVSNTLRVFCGMPAPSDEVDRDLLALMGKLTEVKKWLAASLDKTIRLQMSPPPELREISTMSGPDWIRQ